MVDRMALRTLKKFRTVLRTLNPREVRKMARRPLTVGILASHEPAYESMVRFLFPPDLPEPAAQQGRLHILRIANPTDFDRCDLGLAESHLDSTPRFYPFDPQHPGKTIHQILDEHEDLWLPVAREFEPFRSAVVDRLIFRVARENAVFAVASALPNVAPLLFQLPWAVGEFASDTVVLTMNQIRLAFLIAAATNAPVGFTEQKGQIASITAGAFGWRALAREMVSKAPFGAGLIPKGLIAFAGTYVVGIGLERYLREGRSLTREQRREHYATAYERGRSVVAPMVERFRAKRAAG